MSLQLEIKENLAALKGLKCYLDRQQYLIKNYVTEAINTSKKQFKEQMNNLLTKMKSDHEKQDKEKLNKLKILSEENDKYRDDIVVLKNQLSMKNRENNRMEESHETSRQRFIKLYSETIKALSVDKNQVISGIKQELDNKHKEMQVKDTEFTSYVNLIKHENEMLKSQIQDSINFDPTKSQHQGNDLENSEGKINILLLFI